MIMSQLGLPIPEFKLQRRIIVSTTPPDKNGNTLLSVVGRDMDGLPFSFFKEVTSQAVYNCITLRLLFLMGTNFSEFRFKNANICTR